MDLMFYFIKRNTLINIKVLILTITDKVTIIIDRITLNL